MKIAILGTRGIPNNYGGFEQFAEIISVELVKRGHKVVVYNPHFHPYKENEFKGVQIKRAYSPENIIGAAANFIYDFICFKDALKQDFDIILECGYHSNAPSYYLKRKKHKAVLITNMDGIEWKRSKWGGFTKWLIRKLEKIAVDKSDVLVSDNIGIQEYYRKEFNKESVFIAYGANPIYEYDKTKIGQYSLKENEYFLLIARLEPENNIETILDGYVLSKSEYPFIVIGNHNTKYGNFLKNKYQGKNIRFIGGVYDKNMLDNLRCYSRVYFHGHSVGGTNPSLLEAMASNAFIAAHNNPFNKYVLENNALYFNNPEDVKNIINNYNTETESQKQIFKENNIKTIATKYSWNNITDMYENLLLKCI